MKIRELKISNLMSFWYVNDLDDFEWMNFEKSEDNSDMNILIGANGSWKSNYKNILDLYMI